MSDAVKIQVTPEPTPVIKPEEKNVTPPAPVIPEVTPPTEKPKAPEAKPEDQKVEQKQEAEEKKAFAVDSYEKEFQEQGKLSDESYTKLEAQGYPRDVVDKYIAGQQAIAAAQTLQAEQNKQTIFTAVGGEDQYKSMIQWASQNLSAEERTAFNATMGTGDMGQIKLAVAGLKTRFESIHGHDPKLIGGKAGPSGQSGFRSMAEMTAAMRDPRYQRDPAYRADVIRRVELM